MRVIFNHATIVDSVNGLHVWEHDAYPHYYFPVSEIRQCTTRDRRAVKSDGVSRAAVVELTVHARNGIGEKRTDRVLRFSEDRSLGALAGLVRLEFGSMRKTYESLCGFGVGEACMQPNGIFLMVEVLLIFVSSIHRAMAGGRPPHPRPPQRSLQAHRHSPLLPPH